MKRRTIVLCWMALPLALLTLGPGELLADEVIIPGKVVTGLNRYLGQPHVDFGGPVGLGGFETLGAFNPEGDAPELLAPDMPDTTLLATYLDPDFLANVGVDPAAVDPSLINVPLREVATSVDLTGLIRAPLPGSDTVPLYAGSQTAPVDPVDLATWNRARGVVSFDCQDDGTSQFLLAARNLLPNRLYSVFGFYVGPTGFITPPFGGLPSAFITDSAGRGSMRRTLNGCPLEPGADEPIPLLLLLQFHSDHKLNGLFPGIPQSGGGLGLGAIVHVHLEFLLLGQPLLEPEGWGDDPCLPGKTTHCLQDGRFEVKVSHVDFQGQSGPGKTVDFGSDDSGSFYFFDRDNHEVTVKVLDGCDFNQHFWVFAASATDVEYDLTVTDTRTGQSRTYSNELGNPAPAVTDTAAFATCP